MPSITWPYDDPYVYNTLIVGSYVIPGRAELAKGIPIRRSVDVKKPKGKSGATSTDNGREPVTGIVYRIHQFKREHHDEWQRILPAIDPGREGATKEPFECLNAYLWERNLKNLKIIAITCGPYDTKGKRIIEIEFDEWMPEPKTVKKGTSTPKKFPGFFVRSPLGAIVAGWNDGKELNLGGVNPFRSDPLQTDSKDAIDPSDIGSIMGKLDELGKK